MELSKIHDCEKCHGKIVVVSIDSLGVTRCSYCNEIVDYTTYTNSKLEQIKEYGFKITK